MSCGESMVIVRFLCVQTSARSDNDRYFQMACYCAHTIARYQLRDRVKHVDTEFPDCSARGWQWMLSTEFRAEEAPHKLYSCFGFCRHPQTLFGVAGQQDQTSHWRVRLTRPHRPRRRTQAKGLPRHPQDSRSQKWPRFKLSPRTSPSLVRTSSSSASGTPRSACNSILG